MGPVQRVFSQSRKDQIGFEAFLYSLGTIQNEPKMNSFADISAVAGAMAAGQLLGREAQRLMGRFLAQYQNLANDYSGNLAQIATLSLQGANAAAALLATLNAQNNSDRAANPNSHLAREAAQSSIDLLGSGPSTFPTGTSPSPAQRLDLASLPQAIIAPSGAIGSAKEVELPPSGGAISSLPSGPASYQTRTVVPGELPAFRPYGDSSQLAQSLLDIAYSMKNALGSASEAILNDLRSAQQPYFGVMEPGEAEAAIESLKKLMKSNELALQALLAPDDVPSTQDAIVSGKATSYGQDYLGSGPYFGKINFLEFLRRLPGLSSLEIVEAPRAGDIIRTDMGAGAPDHVNLDGGANGASSSRQAGASLSVELQKAIDGSGKFSSEAGLDQLITVDEHGQIASNRSEASRASMITAAHSGHDDQEAVRLIERDADGGSAALTFSKEGYSLGRANSQRSLDLDRSLSISEGAGSSNENAASDHFESSISGESARNQEALHPSKNGFETQSPGHKDIISQLVDRASMAVKEGKGIVKIHLQPEHLGNVRLEIMAQNNSVRAIFLVENSAVKEAIEANLGQLRESLSGHGLKADKFSVSVGFNSNGGASFQAYRFGESALGGGAGLLGNSSSARIEGDVPMATPVNVFRPAATLDIFA